MASSSEVSDLKKCLEELKDNNERLKLIVKEKDEEIDELNKKYSKLHKNFSVIRERYFKAFKHVCKVQASCSYRTHRPDYLKSHMKTCRKRSEMNIVYLQSSDEQSDHDRDDDNRLQIDEDN